MFYQGDVNRLSTDPQTRNYLQDGMGMCYINSNISRKTLLTALSQQHISGMMPDGVLLHADAELKYINQIPHADHCVWLPICLSTYINESGDIALLNEELAFTDSTLPLTVIEHIELALDYLLTARDYRGLSYIEQGDWCDPMNMVGYLGKGVSSWLSLATSYALQCWCNLCDEIPGFNNTPKLAEYRLAVSEINAAVNQYLWDGQWYARGITDNNTVFGVKSDSEGRIFLNPQSWSILADAADIQQRESIYHQVDEQLMTPFGVMMLAPSYTQMREDIGRITQKSPGVAENGSVYNHASIFYAYSLFQAGQADAAFNVLKLMLPSEQNSDEVGQLPAFIPNYYRGAYYQSSKHAGRSSHLVNTGTISWYYRCLVEELCGLKGCVSGLFVKPKLPEHMSEIMGERVFRGAIFDFLIRKQADISNVIVKVDGKVIAGNLITEIVDKQRYQLEIIVPVNKR